MGRCATAFTALTVLAAALTAAAQESAPAKAGAHPPLARYLLLLSQRDVQEDLKLSADQLEKIDASRATGLPPAGRARDLQPEDLRRMGEERNRAMERVVTEVLSPAQQKRLRQIDVQRDGLRSLQRQDVREALDLTDVEEQKLADFQEDVLKRARTLLRGVDDPAEIQKRLRAFRKENLERAVKLLTPQQQAKWKAIAGEPFAGEIRLVPLPSFIPRPNLTRPRP